jgi:hypothetical protein
VASGPRLARTSTATAAGLDNLLRPIVSPPNSGGPPLGAAEHARKGTDDQGNGDEACLLPGRSGLICRLHPRPFLSLIASKPWTSRGPSPERMSRWDSPKSRRGGFAAARTTGQAGWPCLAFPFLTRSRRVWTVT